jgi:thiosulfate dehydrogenase
LIASRTTMVAAWDFPRNPLADATLDTSASNEIRWGFRIFTNTPGEAHSSRQRSCANCHLNAGQRERSLPLVGVAGMFPEYNARAARLISLPDRVVDCFLRSENAAGRMDDSSGGAEAEPAPPVPVLSTSSKEVLAVTAYVTWLSRGYALGANPTWRGRNAIAADKLIPVNTLDARGGDLPDRNRVQKADGQESRSATSQTVVGTGFVERRGGAARAYLAGIRYSMPGLDPGSLSDEEAQQLAAFIVPAASVLSLQAAGLPPEKLPVDSVPARR